MICRTALWAGPLMLVLLVGQVRADDASPDPGRFIPESAELFVRVENPRALVESFTEHDLIKEFLNLGSVKDQLANTPDVRRFLQLVAHFEKELGHTWPVLLDRLAGGGIAMGVSFNLGSPQAILVIQGTDEALTRKFLTLATDLIESELERTESETPFERGDYRGIPGYRLGDLRVGQVGSAIVMGSTQDAAKAALDLHLGREAGVAVKSMAEADGPKQARKLLPEGKPLAWGTVRYGAYKSTPDAKEILETPRNDPLPTLLFAGWLDVAARSDFATAGLFHDDDGFRVAIRFPARRDGLPEELSIHVPPTGEGGTLPLLQPRGTILSHSFYLDLDALYRHRDKLLTPENVAQLEQVIKEGSKITPFASIPELLKYSGTHHRIVVARPVDLGYTKKPAQPIPSIAFVTTMRDRRFARNAEPLLRAAALLATTQVGLKINDEKYRDAKIVSYRFAEDRDVPEDPDNLRFGFEPCFAIVDDHFILCGNVELCKELIDLLRTAGPEKPQPGNMRARVFAKGGQAYLETIPDQVITQAVLDQAILIDDARKQLRDLLDLLSKAGHLTFETEHGTAHFSFDITWSVPKR